MWTLEHIHAENFSAFKTLDYSPTQKHTTLIFGNNMDNDSQKSNGSGKSALIEAIAVGLTGATLRNIKTEEIINDNADEAVVALELLNDFSHSSMKITRTLSRKNPQAISVLRMDFDNLGRNLAEPYDVPQASVADYNKYILEEIGLTKDDIYSNFILCKHKYQSFLSSSDKDKKEIINRFSNGSMVDESIAALQADMIPVKDRFDKAVSELDVATGRVSAIEEQIENAISQVELRSKTKASKIAEWNEAIADKREMIRQKEEAIRESNETIERYNRLSQTLEAKEKAKGDIQDIYLEVKELLTDCGLGGLSDYSIKIKDLEQSLKEAEANCENYRKKSLELESSINAMKGEYSGLQKEYEEFVDKKEKALPEIRAKIDSLLKEVKELESVNGDVRRERSRLDSKISDLKKRLAGVITCPKCKHEFVLDNEIDVQIARDTLTSLEMRDAECGLQIERNQKVIEEKIEDGKMARQDERSWSDEESVWSDKLTAGKSRLNRLQIQYEDIFTSIKSSESSIYRIEGSIEHACMDMFDEAFSILDRAYNYEEHEIGMAQTHIDNAKGAIESYEESIRDIENASETDIVSSLKESKEKYLAELGLKTKCKEEAGRELDAYKVQEQTFVEFKTHLANSKIEALSQITNEFLEAIGSDIRILFSGYTVLKSGKVRDKISISLIRDGVNCGSFDKFSEGEKTRVNLANILAMHKLTNVGCEEGKGLDLLVLDEILDATDETGLANIFEALGSLHITSLVVSHGNIAENYPHKLIVNKENGVSFI